MADITPHYSDLRKSVYAQGLGKEELKALPGGLPSKAELIAAFQGLEDAVVAAYPTWKSGLEADLGGVTLTNPAAQKIIAGYLKWKIQVLLGV